MSGRAINRTQRHVGRILSINVVSLECDQWVDIKLVRLLFRLDVKDTQVGLKVFRREIAEQVLPLLLVKRYAFDIELLVVARAFGFDRIEEPEGRDYPYMLALGLRR